MASSALSFIGSRLARGLLVAGPALACALDMVAAPGLSPASVPPMIRAGDVLLELRYAARVPGGIRRGDVVVMRSPREPAERLVARVVAMDGDWVVATPAAEAALASWQRRGADAAPTPAGVPGDEAVLQIPRGHCWVEGDQSPGCTDSASAFGPVPQALIESRVAFVCWPPARFGPCAARSAQRSPGRVLLERRPNGTVHRRVGDL